MRRSKLAKRIPVRRALYKRFLASWMSTKKAVGSDVNDCLSNRSAASKSGFSVNIFPRASK
jgi:hypothetical protein